MQKDCTLCSIPYAHALQCLALMGNVSARAAYIYSDVVAVAAVVVVAVAAASVVVLCVGVDVGL